MPVGQLTGFEYGQIPGSQARDIRDEQRMREYLDWLRKGGGFQNLQNVGKQLFGMRGREVVDYATGQGPKPSQKLLGWNQGDVLGQALDFVNPMAKVAGLIGQTVGSSGLAMDKASRMARARELGFNPEEVWYHGTTHEFPEFGRSRLTPESHFGAAHYFTSDPYDASVNYAGRGPDLTNRIESRAGQLETEGIEETQARVQAAKELQGHGGAIIPAMIRQQKTFDLTGDTRLEYGRRQMDPEDYMDEARSDTYRDDFDDIEDYNEAVKERAQELADEDSLNFEPEGDLVDFIDSLKWNDAIDDDSKQKIIGAIQERAMDYDGLTASELDEIMRKTEWYAEDPNTGMFVNNEVYRQALEDAGFTGIKMPAETTFGNMDIPAGTSHYIAFNPQDIRSIQATFDPGKRRSSDILAGLAGAGLGISLLSAQRPDAD